MRTLITLLLFGATVQAATPFTPYLGTYDVLSLAPCSFGACDIAQITLVEKNGGVCLTEVSRTGASERCFVEKPSVRSSLTSHFEKGEHSASWVQDRTSAGVSETEIVEVRADQISTRLNISKTTFVEGEVSAFFRERNFLLRRSER